jgi:hypothetical protein
VLANLIANALCKNRKWQAETALHCEMGLYKKKAPRGEHSPPKMPHASVAAALKKASRRVIERKHLSAPVDETEEKKLRAVDERFLKLWNHHTERELLNDEAIVEAGSVSLSGSRPHFIAPEKVRCRCLRKKSPNHSESGQKSWHRSILKARSKGPCSPRDRDGKNFRHIR